jgi:hypothetical protein
MLRGHGGGHPGGEVVNHGHDAEIREGLTLRDHLAECGRTRPISLHAFHFLSAHGGAAPFTLRL